MRKILILASFSLALSAQDNATYIPAEEIQAYLKRSDLILIPMASTEQHGPHLPLSTDTTTAYEVSKRAAEQAAAQQAAAQQAAAQQAEADRVAAEQAAPKAPAGHWYTDPSVG